MTAKELILDFITLLFIIFLGVFSLVYFVLGDKFHLVLEFLRALIPLSFFGLLLAFKLRTNEKRKKKRESEGNLEMELWLSYIDKAKSEYFLYSLPVVLIFIPVVSTGTLDIFDVLQAGTCFALAYLWQRSLFRKKGEYDKKGITIKINYSDKIKGDALAFSLPIITLLLPSIFLTPLDKYDIAQAIVVFMIAVFWQYFIFSKEI